MDYDWINTEEASVALGNNIILFGAGKGSEEMISYVRRSTPETTVLFIVDNDKSLNGKKLLGSDVLPPEKLTEINRQLIVVTSVSGRDAISEQLKRMGFEENEDFILVGKYPESASINNFKIIQEHLSEVNGKALHIGPGGFLGLEAMMIAAGCSSVSSIDKHTFGIKYPEVTTRLNEYNELRGKLNDPVFGLNNEKTLSVFDDLFIRKNGSTFIDSDKIDYKYPMDVCKLNFPDNSFDLVFSFAVLEHVKKPEDAISEISRVMKKGAVCLHKIITTDHRAFSSIEGYNPFSYRSYSHDEWDTIIKDKFYQNRLLPVQWKRLFEKNGFEVKKYIVGSNIELSDEKLSSFSDDFSGFTKEELGELDCIIVAEMK